MSKPTPPHHVEVLIPFHTVERGYATPRQNAQAGSGLWSIVAACPTSPEDREKGWIRVIVAPARVPT